MTTIQEVVLQIKDKHVIWEDKAEEVYFKKNCFSTLLIRIILMLVLTVAV